MSKNDTLDKIDEAIKKIQNEDFSDDEVLDENNKLNEETDTKIFTGDENSNNSLEVTKEFTDVIEKTKKLQEVKEVQDVKVSEEVTKNSNIGIYIGYFISLIVVVVLILIFILFLYN